VSGCESTTEEPFCEQTYTKIVLTISVPCPDLSEVVKLSGGLLNATIGLYGALVSSHSSNPLGPQVAPAHFAGPLTYFR
jgi:hypothetical protein